MILPDSHTMTTPAKPVRIPNESALLDVLAALGGNVEHYERLAVHDIYDKTETALAYASTFLGPLIQDCPGPLQAAIDCAAELRDATRERLMGAVQMSDFPQWLKNAPRIATLTDDALRWSAINAAFSAELDRQEGGTAEVFIIRRHDDGTQVFRRIGIRDVPQGKQ